MRRRNLVAFIVSSLVIGGLHVSNVSAIPMTGIRETYIVVYKDEVGVQAEVDNFSVRGLNVHHIYSTVFKGVAVDLNATDARALAANPRVQSIERDGIVTTMETQTGVTWGIDRSDQRPSLLNNSYTYPESAGSGVTIYVVDTGIWSDHSEFTGRLKPGYSTIKDGRGTGDCDGHGTHVAGTAAGTKYGIAKKAWIVPVRVLDCRGSGKWSNVIKGLDWIGRNVSGPAVVNLSIGGKTNSSLEAAVRNLHNKFGVTVVAAAGNSSRDACNYSPSRVPEAITVGATTSSDARASYSNIGTCLDLFAPGSDITSAGIPANSDDSGTTTEIAVLSGTSMAAPHVTGAAALALGEFPNLSNIEVRDRLVDNATKDVISSPGSGSPNKLLFIGTPGPPVVIETPPMLTPATQSSSYSATLEATGGDDSNYEWSASGLPSGLSLSGNIISGTPTTCGVFPVAVMATSGWESAVKQLTLTVDPPNSGVKPSEISMLSPDDRSTNVPRSLTLSWSPSENSCSYQVCVTRNSSGCSSTSKSWQNAAGTSITASSLARRTTYYWQVRAMNPTGTTTSPIWRFSTRR